MSLVRFAEYHNILNQESINARQQFHHRSGHREGDGAEMLDLYAHSPSPEEILISAEEEEEKRRAVVRALMVTRRYLVNVFNAVELEFIKRVITTDDTPAKIAKSLNAEYYSLSKILFSKFAATSKYLLDEFYKCGYYCQSALDFLPRLAVYVAQNEANRRWISENAERHKAQKREYYKAHCKTYTPEELEERRKARLEVRLAKLPLEEREKARLKAEQNARYYTDKKLLTPEERDERRKARLEARLATLSPEEREERKKNAQYMREYRARRKKAAQV